MLDKNSRLRAFFVNEYGELQENRPKKEPSIHWTYRFLKIMVILFLLTVLLVQFFAQM
jgi:hypothetical protein